MVTPVVVPGTSGGLELELELELEFVGEPGAKCSTYLREA